MLIYTIAIALAGILVTSIVAFPITTTNAQQQQQQEVESADGGLTATLNGDSFATYDTIMISGSVAEQEPRSHVTVEVTDPQGKTVEQAFCDVTADNTFKHSFIAGERQQEEELDPNQPMITSGNYRMIVTYFPPPPTPSDESVMEQVEFVFGYNADWITVGDRSHVNAYDGDATPADG
jgi:hypothetical protein